MSTEKEDIELLMNRVEAMREAQRHYFRFRGDTWKKKSMGLEMNVDALCKLLRRKGYDPGKFNGGTEQTKLL